MESGLIELWLNRWQVLQPQQVVPDLQEFLAEHAIAATTDKHAVLLMDQKFRWRTPQPMRVEDYLRQVPELRDDADKVLQLVVGEFESRLSNDSIAFSNEAVRNEFIEDYSTRFSFLGETLRSKLQLIASDSDAGKTVAPSSKIPVNPLKNVSSNPSDADLPTSSNISPMLSRGDPPTPQGDDLVATVVLEPHSVNQITHIGRYRRMRLLGEGAFGFVWLGLDDELQRYVAIKVPRPERFRGPEDAEQYLAEARTVASLDHPHIVPVYDVGRTEAGAIYVVSKFIEGCTLADRLKQQKLSHEEVTKLLATVAQALHHAHQRRLVHRDVKPANILIEERTGTTYVADFGLAIREEDYLRDNRTAGTPGYMSPEQVRGEGHRLDGRSDIFSLGVIMYEMLTGKRPFRGSNTNELFHQVISVDPPTPRTVDDAIPVELDRICLRALSKRAADRYASGIEFADDLSHWQQGPEISYRELTIVPKGLRSFDAGDSGFFLDLLPGPRDRDGLPESIRFWKKKIEESDPEKTFSVGLIYGPSGCGKSSLVKAGLIPRLSKEIEAFYIEATPEETETRILRALRKKIADLPTDLSLTESFLWLRRRPSSGKMLAEGSTAPQIVVILDQFEQWLHSHRTEQGSELVAALRQCDGGQLQAIAMVRDDFAMAAARFMDSLEVPIVQGENFATVDLFDVDHAEQVLIKFGRAFGKLPANSASLSDDQKSFVSAVASGLARDGKVVSVRLSLFAEMIKGKTWTSQTLTDVGGTEGIGVNFLEETFSSRNANPTHRLHEQAARAVLKALLPEISTDIKGHMRSHADLFAESGYESRPSDFNTLLRILDGELRLITPTDPEGHTDSSRDWSLATRYYQLTHDYMVPSLRAWLTRKQQETRAGRAELKLAERSNLWTEKPENRYLPSITEWGTIRTLTDRSKWTPPQQAMMSRANRVHGSRFTGALTMAVLLIFGGLWIKAQVDLGQQRITASGLVKAMLNAETRDVPKLVAGLASYRQWADPELQNAVSSTDAKTQLHARIALLPVDPKHAETLQEALLEATPENVLVLRDVLQGNHNRISEFYWKILEASDSAAPQRRLAAGAALAKFAPKDVRWTKVASPISKLLVDENPLRLATWIEAFRTVRASLVPELGVIFRDQSESVSQAQRDLATNILESYAADDVDQLANLIVDAQPKQFAALFDEFKAYGEAATQKMLDVLAQMPSRPPLWERSDVVSLAEKPVPSEIQQKIEYAKGYLTDRFALVQTLPLDQTMAISETLGQSGYRPVRLRPYNSIAVKPNPSIASEIAEPFVAAIWHRDGRAWRVVTDLTAAELLARDEQFRSEGFAVVDAAGYISVRDDQPAELFVAIWVKPDNDVEDSRLYLAATDKTHKTAYADLEKAGYLVPNSLQVFRGLDGKPRLSGVKTKKTGEWSQVWEQSPENYKQVLHLDKLQCDINLSLAKSLESLKNRFDINIAEATAILESPAAEKMSKIERYTARLRRAVALYQQANVAEAMIDLDILTSARSKLPDAYQYRALCNARLGNRQAAEEDLAKVNELLKSPATVAYTTAIVHAYFGEFEEAEKVLMDFAAIVPQQGDGLYSLACAYSVLASIATSKDQTLSTRYQEIAIENLKLAIVSNETDVEQLLIEPDFELLLTNVAVESLLMKDLPTRLYAALWNPIPGIESRELLDMTPDEHRQAMKKLEGEGFFPTAISGLATEIGGETFSGSIWHRITITAAASEQLAKQKSNAAAALARLGQREKIFSALRITEDPESLTQFVHRCRGAGVTARELWDCVEVVVLRRQALNGDSRRIEDRVLFGLLLALGEFHLDEVPEDIRELALDKISEWFSDDPSSAIHGVTGWLLRQWEQTEVVKRVDQTAVEYDPNREWFTLAIKAEEHQFYQTYVVIAPGDYDIGSPHGTSDLEADEKRNRIRLTSPVAILDREITRGEFEASGIKIANVAQFSPTHDHPMVSPSWYDSVQYCRWLTARAGISEADQVYADPKSIDKSAYPRDSEVDYPKNWPMDLNKRGFRLPTEAEWEIAARGGMQTNYGFGADESLLNRHAWFQDNSERRVHTAKQLRPNLYGFFEMLGSVNEWCHDWYAQYPIGNIRLNPIGADSGSGRVNRGGSWGNVAALCRSADRNSSPPAYRGINDGFRVALVPFTQDKKSVDLMSGGSAGTTQKAENKKE